jgi:PHD/YefM family antitoxin component YafN of YafNO toxin-antitoxin module
MTMTTISSREFNQDTSKAKKAAMSRPVFITNRRRPTHVLLSIEHYQSLVAPAANIIDLLAMPGAEKVRFVAPRVRKLAKAADLT